MINEIPTQSRSLSRFIGTILCVVVAAGASALILTAPVWSADDLAALPTARGATVTAPAEGSDTGSASRGDGP
ncbi:hypothetical protein [Roseateles sp.]|uniref:hypothetical protein n=1 Tax=Roseateles sp. TaxID=1971397 RepID=UPI002F406C9A